MDPAPALRQRLFERPNSKERETLASELLSNPSLMTAYLALVLADEAPYDFHAAWVLDGALRKDPRTILPYWRQTVSGCDRVRSESVIRPLARWCADIARRGLTRSDPDFEAVLDSDTLDLMIERCFGWLIDPHRIAAQVFAMEALYHLGAVRDWVRPELQAVLESGLDGGSPGYRNRGRKLLHLLDPGRHAAPGPHRPE